MSYLRRNDPPKIPPARNGDAQYEANRAALLGTGGGYPNRGNSASPRPGAQRTTSDDGPGYGRYGSSDASGDGDRYAGSAYGNASDSAPNKLRRPPPSGAMGNGGPASYRQQPQPEEPQNNSFSRDRYGGQGGRYATANDAYARGERNIDRDRAQLFAGASKEPGARAGATRFNNGPADDEEEDVEGIKGKTRALKQESVNSTRNALRMAREAEETARNTLTRLGDQSDSLLNTERNLDLARGNVNRADDNTTEINALNRSIFIPAVTLNKNKKRLEQEAKLTARYESERAEHDRLQADRREVHQRLGAATTSGLRSFNRDGPPQDDDEGTGGRQGVGRSGQQQFERKKQWGRYQFEATASDDEQENEIDDNLDELGDAVGRLKALAIASGQEVDRQNNVLEKLHGKTDNVDRKVRSATDRLNRVGR